MPEERQQAIKQAGLKSRAAMIWLRDHKLPADPICYTIAYEYLHTERVKLKQEIEAINIDDDDYLEKIRIVYQECIIAEDYEQLAMSGDIGNQYVSEILSLLLKSQNKIKDNSAIMTAVKTEINDNPTKNNDLKQNKDPQTNESDASIETIDSRDEYLQVAEKASKDELTSALDFNGLKQSLISAIKHADNFPVCLLKINIDRFKQFNDTNGKFIGDAVLKNIVKTLQNQLKGSDLTSRLKSDEFLVLLPKTKVKNAVSVADKLRIKIAALVLKKKNSSVALKFTVSIGVAEMKTADAFESTLEKCQKALSRSKDLGRNCVNKDD